MSLFARLKRWVKFVVNVYHEVSQLRETVEQIQRLQKVGDLDAKAQAVRRAYREVKESKAVVRNVAKAESREFWNARLSGLRETVRAVLREEMGGDDG